MTSAAVGKAATAEILSTARTPGTSKVARTSATAGSLSSKKQLEHQENSRIASNPPSNNKTISNSASNNIDVNNSREPTTAGAHIKAGLNATAGTPETLETHVGDWTSIIGKVCSNIRDSVHSRDSIDVNCCKKTNNFIAGYALSQVIHENIFWKP